MTILRAGELAQFTGPFAGARQIVGIRCSRARSVPGKDQVFIDFRPITSSARQP